MLPHKRKEIHKYVYDLNTGSINNSTSTDWQYSSQQDFISCSARQLVIQEKVFWERKFQFLHHSFAMFLIEIAIIIAHMLNLSWNNMK